MDKKVKFTLIGVSLVLAILIFIGIKDISKKAKVFKKAKQKNEAAKMNISIKKENAVVPGYNFSPKIKAKVKIPKHSDYFPKKKKIYVDPNSGLPQPNEEQKIEEEKDVSDIQGMPEARELTPD